MKGSNSRFSHRPGARYSNLAHVQGGMVTDADLTETGQLHQARDEAQNAVTIQSGSPAQDGAVRIKDGAPGLAEGWIIAQGKQGALRSRSGTPGTDPLALYEDQADLPLGPRLGDTPVLLYADLWERPVFSLLDGYLADPGLHGAETSYRTRTMTQIKALPLDDEDAVTEARKRLAEGLYPFAATGTALALVKPKDTEIAVDDCDPCADQIEVEQTLPNALFRLEVIAVARDDQGKPTAATLAWSFENAAAIETAKTLSDSSSRKLFERKKAVYEFFSEATESQIGVFADGHAAERPVLVDKLAPAPSPAGGANGGEAYSHVRRWDGAATLNLAGDSVTKPMGTGKMALKQGKATLTLDFFTLDLAVKDAELIAGDYWLVELRRYAAEDDRVRLVGGDTGKAAPPHGVRHHFCALFAAKGGEPLALDDAGIRRLSFPPLIDIPASHVSFTPDCPDFFDKAQTVDEALNALCDLDATQVAYDPSGDCERFEGVSTVHQALERMCKVQDDTALSRVLRLMMDWGVVCGINITASATNKTAINWSGGTMLDRSGRLIDVKAGQIDLAQLPPEAIHGKLPGIQEKEGSLCVSLAADRNGTLSVHLSDRDTAFGPADPTYQEALRACEEGRKAVDFGDKIRILKPEEVRILKNVIDVSANRKALDGAVPLTQAEAEVAAAVTRTLAEEYMAKAPPHSAERVKALIELAEKEYNPNAIRGDARDKRRMQLEAAKIGILAAAEEQDKVECRCIHALIPCPPDAGKPPHLVPVGCLRVEFEGDRPAQVLRASPYCCRKQAMTWRSRRYVWGVELENWMLDITDGCRSSRKPPGEGLGDWLDEWEDDLVKPFPTPRPDPRPEPDPLWPPKQFPRPIYEYPYPIGDLIGGGGGPLINPRPEIAKLPPAVAAEVLAGNGFDVVETIDLDSGDPLARIKQFGAAEASVLGKTTPEPGDKVIMMARDGKVVDYLVVEKGSGKLPFETKAGLEDKIADVIGKGKSLPGPTPAPTLTPAPTPAPTPALPDLEAFENRLNVLIESKDAAQAEVDKLIAEREKLAVEVKDLGSSFSELADRRAAASEDLNASRAELAALDREKAAAAVAIRATVAELEDVKKDHKTFVTEMRRDQPIGSVIANNPRAVEVLRSNGIVSLRDIEALDTTRLTAVLRGTGLTGSALKSSATRFIER